MINPALKKLGFTNNDRVVVFHADDIGMCHASVAAYAELLGNSPLSSAATMVPCPWFPAAARVFREQANNPSLDIGVHLTLTSEWDAMRWGPLSTGDVETGLFDDEGYFYRTVKPTQTHPKMAAVSAELQAQIARAQAADIDVTHLDTHMGVLLSPRYLQLYTELGFEHGVPALAARLSAEQLVEVGYGADSAEKIAAYSTQLEARGMPLFDGISYLPLHEKQSVAERLEVAKAVLDSAEPGLYYFIIHPSIDTPELRALAPDWEARVADHNLFLSSAWQQTVDASGVHVIGMKPLRTLLRQNQNKGQA